MSVTIIDIAKKIGVSYTTVSRALNGKPGVNEETRKKILEESKRMNYQPNAIARGLVSKYTNTIGLIIPDISNPYFPAIARGIEDAARLVNYDVFLCNTNWDAEREKSCIQALLQKRVDGIIINPNSSSNLDFISDLNIPIVLLNSKNIRGNHSYINVDNCQGGFLATEHLIKSNYKKIAFVGGTTNSDANNQRLNGYKEALSYYGVETNESYIINGEFNLESGYNLTKQLLSLQNPPDAIFAANDIIALGVMQCIQEFNLDIPTQFGIVGFDDIYSSQLPQIQLSTIQQPTYFIGKKSFEVFLDKVNGNDQDNLVKQILLDLKLIVRKTTSVG